MVKNAVNMKTYNTSKNFRSIQRSVNNTIIFEIFHNLHGFVEILVKKSGISD